MTSLMLFIYSLFIYINYEGEMDLDYTFIEPKNRDITYAMTNNLGFGGHNASMIVKKFAE